MTDKLEPPFAGACKPVPRWAEELRAEQHALKQSLKEYMEGLWEQAIVRSKQQLMEEQESRFFWQNRVLQEMGKTFKASSDTNQELAVLQGQVQKLAQTAERQQFLLEAIKTTLQGMPQQVQNLSRAVDRQHQAILEANKVAAPLEPVHGDGIAKQSEPARPVPHSELVEAVNRSIQMSLVESERRMLERLDEMQAHQLARLNAIQDDSRLDAALLHLKNVDDRLPPAQSTESTEEPECNTGDPLIHYGKCPSLVAGTDVNPVTQVTQARSMPSIATTEVQVKMRKSISASVSAFEGYASSKETADSEEVENGQLRDLFDNGPIESSVDRCLRYVNYISFFLVASNAVYMGIRVDVSFRAIKGGEDDPRILHVIEHLFTASFVIELIVRFVLEKLAFFYGPNATWNIFDSVVVTFQLFEAVEIHNLRNTTFVRIIRIARIVRTARALRTLKNLRILRLIMAPEVWLPLFWGVALMMTMVYLFAVFMTTVVMDHVRLGEDLPQRALELYGSVTTTQYTLFMAVTGGEAWAELVAPLEAIATWHGWLFCGYMVLLLVGVMNTVSAVYVDALLHFSSLDRDVVMTERNSIEKGHLRQLRNLLKNQPLTDEGLIEQKHLISVITGDGAQHFKALGLQFPMAKALFRLLDVEDARAIEVDEYIYGLLHLKGNAATIHMATLMYQSKRLLFKVQKISTLVEDRVMPMLMGTDPQLLGFVSTTSLQNRVLV